MKLKRVVRRSWAAPILRAGAVAAAIATVGIGLLWASTDVDRARFVRPSDSLVVVDRHGTALRHHRPGGVDRRWVELSSISPHLVSAIVAIEDQRFYEHHGVDVRSAVRAVFTIVLPGRRASGASTITQQLIKRVYGRPHGVLDKPREIVRAAQLERRFDKRWILEQYLNRVPFGEPIVGVARASEVYFGKPVSDLTVAEAALLAGIPQAPSALDPRRNLPAAMRRQRLVLARMRATGRIDEATYRAARAQSITIARRPARPWIAPRFVDGAVAEWRAGRIDREGGRLPTSLDAPLQARAEAILRAAVARHSSRGVTNAAAIVVANRSGEILAYVGAARHGDDAPGAWLDLVRAHRQPGSTLKPFVYALLFERGGHAATILDDLSTPMTGGRGELFFARDYDGRERGPVRARVALASSLNLAALDAARRVGPDRIATRLRRLGMRRVGDSEAHGAAIVLGGVGVSPFELASAYVALARGGTAIPLSWAPVRGLPSPTEAIDPASAQIVRDILRDPRARREGFGDDLVAHFGEPTFALKTGTSHGWRDAWTAVFTDEITAIVWLGDPAGRPLGGLSGFEGAARPAVELLRAAHDRIEALGIEPSLRDEPPLTTARICAATGALVGERCSSAVDERFVEGRAPTERCTAHDERGVVILPARYARWIDTAHPSGFRLASSGAGVAATTPRIEYPVDGARLLIDPRSTATIPLRATTAGATVPARWEVDGRPLEGDRWAPRVGVHTLVARIGGARSEPVTVEVAAP